MAKKKVRDKALILRLVDEGLTLTQISERVGAGRTRLKQWFLRENIPFRFQRSRPAGPGHQRYKGGRTVDKNGYVLILRPGHPMARGGRYVLEHRLIVAEHIGRNLLESEVVHHKNGNKRDNRLENLALYHRNGDHLRDELAGKVPQWSSEGKRRMKEAVVLSNRKRADKVHQRKALNAQA